MRADTSAFGAELVLGKACGPVICHLALGTTLIPQSLLLLSEYCSLFCNLGAAVMRQPDNATVLRYHNIVDWVVETSASGVFLADAQSPAGMTLCQELLVEVRLCLCAQKTMAPHTAAFSDPTAGHDSHPETQK